MSIRAIIADDEDLARQILREYLTNQPDIQIVGECDNGFATVKRFLNSSRTCSFWTYRCRSWMGLKCWNLWMRS